MRFIYNTTAILILQKTLLLQYSFYKNAKSAFYYENFYYKKMQGIISGDYL